MRHQLSRNIQSSKANAKFIASRDQNFGEYSHGHEHIIDHPRRDIFLRRVWLLWGRALVLNGMPQSTQSAVISEGYPAMVKATVERMVKGNADALDKNGQAEKKIAKRNNDAVTDRPIGVNPEGCPTPPRASRQRSPANDCDRTAGLLITPHSQRPAECAQWRTAAPSAKSSPDSFRAPYSEAVNQNHLLMPTTLWVRTLAFSAGRPPLPRCPRGAAVRSSMIVASSAASFTSGGSPPDCDILYTALRTSGALQLGIQHSWGNLSKLSVVDHHFDQFGDRRIQAVVATP